MVINTIYRLKSPNLYLHPEPIPTAADWLIDIFTWISNRLLKLYMDESKAWLMSVHQKCLLLYFLVALDDNFIDTLTPFTHTFYL